MIIPERPVVIEGDGLLLREWTAADLPVMTELFDEESIDVWTPLAAPFDEQPPAPTWRPRSGSGTPAMACSSPSRPAARRSARC